MSDSKWLQGETAAAGGSSSCWRIGLMLATISFYVHVVSLWQLKKEGADGREEEEEEEDGCLWDRFVFLGSFFYLPKETWELNNHSKEKLLILLIVPKKWGSTETQERFSASGHQNKLILPSVYSLFIFKTSKPVVMNWGVQITRWVWVPGRGRQKAM